MPRKSVSLTCRHCERRFDASPTVKFCSRRCFVQYSRTTLASQLRGEKPTRRCDNCGDLYKQMGPAQRHCRRPACHWLDHERRVLRPYWETQERTRERVENWALRRHVRALLNRAVRRVDCTDEIERAKDADPELAALIAEQERDERSRGGKSWEVSLDRAHFDDGGGALLDSVTSDAESGGHVYSVRHGYITDAPWVDPLLHALDKRREIDEWGEAA